ncbi:MAG: FAD-binding oxidoreductase, partial [Parahaliea sp.]
EAGLLVDAAVSQSEADCERFWGLRDDVEQTLQGGIPLVFDISLPIVEIEAYIANLREALPGVVGEHKLWVFGHLGDGNLHVDIQVSPGRANDLRPRVEELVYGPLSAFKGSVSAELGIGLEKRAWLKVSRSEQEIQLMQTLKAALDPAGTLNPGKIFLP